MNENGSVNDVSGDISDAVLWQAVIDRDPRYSGRAYYAVRSTGIYCRIDCPSRRPRREQVVFYFSCDEAEQAGFRPCKRCRPRSQAAPWVEWVLQACRVLEDEGPLSLSELGLRLGISPFHLTRKFKAVTGLTPRQYTARLQNRQLKASLRNGQSVTEALYEAGYGSSSRLYETAVENLGMTPGTYLRGGKNMEIIYTIVNAPLVGRMLVASTQNGICAVTFGDHDSELEQALKEEYPRAVLHQDGENLSAWVEKILKHLVGELPHLDLPIDVQATAFQLRVWEELRKIPYGETRTYAQVAESLGRPSAVRAVARACATNPAALVTPCHRVVRSDGGMGGYRWGIARKEVLLNHEKNDKVSADF